MIPMMRRALPTLAMPLLVVCADARAQGDLPDLTGLTQAEAVQRMHFEAAKGAGEPVFRPLDECPARLHTDQALRDTLRRRDPRRPHRLPAVRHAEGA